MNCRNLGFLTLLGLISIAPSKATAEETLSAVEAPKPSAVANETIESPVEGDIQDLLYLAPKHPIFLRLHIQIEGRGFKTLRDAFSLQLFESLDKDHNGHLDADEMKLIPAPAQLAPVRQNGSPLRGLNPRPVDSSPQDGKVTPDELQDYVREAAGTPFAITTVQQQRRVETNLFERLDLDKDGMLTVAEVQATAETLQKFDLNDDELIGSNELATNNQQGVFFAAPQNTNSAAETLTSTLMVVNGDNPSTSTIRKLLHLYDKFSRDEETGFFSKDGKLSAAELGLSVEIFAEYDENADGRLDNRELKTLFSNPHPQLELLIQLGKNATGRAKFKILRSPSDDSEQAIDAQPADDGGMTLLLGGVPMDLQSSARGSQNTNVVDRYKNLFPNADGDNNDYLDNNEIQRLGIPTTVFSAIDRNNDNKIFLPELIEYIKQQALLAKSRTTLNLSNENQTLFDLLDSNNDTRLGLREFRQAVAMVQTWDKNGDGSIESEEMPHNIQMTFGIGQSNLFGRQAANIITSTIQQANGGLSQAGPGWFTKMDRNRDGDVSPREFLGSEVDFEQLDTNNDSLISPNEAEAKK